MLCNNIGQVVCTPLCFCHHVGKRSLTSSSRYEMEMNAAPIHQTTYTAELCLITSGNKVEMYTLKFKLR